MARPQRKRFICCVPENDTFLPKRNTKCKEVYLTVDEYETIRLIDLEKYTQQQCAKHMDISRTTVQEIYESARMKMADVLVNTKKLIISGGNYISCENYCEECGHGNHSKCKNKKCIENA